MEDHSLPGSLYLMMYVIFCQFLNTLKLIQLSRRNLAIINELDIKSQTVRWGSRQLSQSQTHCVQKVLCSKTRDPLFGLLYLQKPLPVLGWVVWSGVHPDKMYNNQKINYMTKSLSKILLEKLALEKMLDYKFESTFWEEFSIAEDYGPEGIHHHYDIVFEQYKDNLKYLTELVLVLNIKIFI